MKVGFDTLGKHDVKYPLPRQAPKIFTLCANFLIKEDNLAVSARTVYTEDIRALLTQSGAAVGLAASRCRADRRQAIRRQSHAGVGPVGV